MKKSKSIRWQITGAFLGFLVLALGLIIFFEYDIHGAVLSGE